MNHKKFFLNPLFLIPALLTIFNIVVLIGLFVSPSTRILNDSPVFIFFAVTYAVVIIPLVMVCVFAVRYLYKARAKDEKVEKEIQELNQLLDKALKDRDLIIRQTMKTFVSFIDNKDPYTQDHSLRVARITKEIAKRLGYDKEKCRVYYYAGLMHDIGKITIADEILNKRTSLSNDEWEIIHQHTTNGAKLLNKFTVFPEVGDAVLYHHERYDGTGYINRLKGKNIPEVARVVCIADSYDAMAKVRSYRLPYSEERIIGEFERCAGKQFDPDLIPYLISMIRDGTVYKF